jgi:hypothetical protein
LESFRGLHFPSFMGNHVLDTSIGDLERGANHVLEEANTAGNGASGLVSSSRDIDLWHGGVQVGCGGKGSGK